MKMDDDYLDEVEVEDEFDYGYRNNRKKRRHRYYDCDDSYEDLTFSEEEIRLNNKEV